MIVQLESKCWSNFAISTINFAQFLSNHALISTINTILIPNTNDIHAGGNIPFLTFRKSPISQKWNPSKPFPDTLYSNNKGRQVHLFAAKGILSTTNGWSSGCNCCDCDAMTFEVVEFRPMRGRGVPVYYSFRYCSCSKLGSVLWKGKSRQY